MNKINNITSREVLDYGEEVSERFKALSDEVSKELDINRTDKSDLLNSLNKILEKIDYNELKLATKTNKKVPKILRGILEKKDKLIKKYINITNELDSMYLSITEWRLELKKNNELLTNLKDNLKILKEDFKNMSKEMEKTILELPSETVEEKELKNLFIQKSQDVQYKIQICEQSAMSLSVALKTNFMLYKKLISVYDTTMPTIKNAINLIRVLKDQKNTIGSLKFLDETRNELLTFLSKESVTLAKDSVNMLGYNETDFKILEDTKEMLRVGVEEIIQIENKRADDIKLLGGKEYEKEKI